MPSRSSPELRRTDQRFRVALTLVAAVIILGIGGAALVAARIARIADDYREAQIDNQTWRTAQFETEYQRFLLALSNALAGGFDADPATAWAEIETRFDVYYSRVDTHAVMLSHLRGLLHDPEEMRRAMGDIVAGRDALARQIDAVTEPTRADVEAVSATAIGSYPEVRALVVQVRDAIGAQAQMASDDFTLLVDMSIRVIIALGVVLLLFGGGALRTYGETMRVARNLALARQNLQTIIDTSPDAVIVCDRDAQILRLNPVAETMLEESQDALLGRDLIRRFLSPRMLRLLRPDAAEMATAELLRHAVGHRLRVLARSRSGRPIFAEVTMAHGHDQHGEVYVIFARDVSDRVIADRQLRRARSRAEQSARAKQRFLSVMSHEMRTPLHGVIAALDLLDGERDPGEAAQLVRTARASAETAINQIDEVLEVARLDSKTAHEAPTVFVPAAVAAEVVAQHDVLAEKAGSRILFDAAPLAEVPTLGQARMFRRALANLLGNACKFTGDGEIAVRLAAGEGGRLRIEVEDSGPGIPAEHLPRLFEDFFTTDTNENGGGGSGLGLPIFAAAVRAMGGQHGVHSIAGEGSLFWFELPLDPRPAAAPATCTLPSAAPAAAPARPRQVLVVDDSDINRELLGKIVTRLGHRPVMAEDGNRAVALARETTFDIILMDIRMPGLDGFGATRQIRAGGASQGAPVYGVTAHLAETGTTRAAAAAAGFADILRKPLTIRDIARLLPPDGAPAAAVPAPAALDRERWEALALAYRAWLEDSVSHLGREVDWLVAHLKAGSPEVPLPVIADAAHAAAGTAAVLGMRSLHELLCALEDACRGSGLADPATAAQVLARAAAEGREAAAKAS